MGEPSQTPAGWYPDPANPGVKIYWDGATWVRPNYTAVDTADKPKPNPAVAVAVCVLAAIGLLMSLQSVSLLTGSTMLWIGVVVIAGAVALAFILPTAVVVRVIAVIALLLALGNVLYMEYQLDQKRNEISRMFNP
jgi:hypothetical protein